MTKPKPIEGQVLEDIDTAIYEIPEPPELEIGDPLLNILSADTEKSLTDDYVNDKNLQDKSLEQIKEEYNFDEIKGTFDEGKILPQLEFSFGGENDNFLQTCNFLSLSEDNNEFFSFLSSDMGQNIMINNSLSIHIETVGIFNNDFNAT